MSGFFTRVDKGRQGWTRVDGLPEVYCKRVRLYKSCILCHFVDEELRSLRLPSAERSRSPPSNDLIHLSGIEFNTC